MKIWITVATWNRASIAKICLEQLSRIKGDNVLHISDDHSTEYTAQEIFQDLADQISKPPRKLGIQRLRCWELRKFLTERREDFIYLTDSDAYHDPGFLDRLQQLWEFRNLPVCLYNSRVHNRRSNIQERSDLFQADVRRTMPGISQLYHREHVIKIVNKLNQVGDPQYAWDYRIPEYLGRPCVTSQISYLEHFGGPGSLHNKTLDKDRALNPTPLLKQIRPSTIQMIQK